MYPKELEVKVHVPFNSHVDQFFLPVKSITFVAVYAHIYTPLFITLMQASYPSLAC